MNSIYVCEYDTVSKNILSGELSNVITRRISLGKYII